MEGFPRFGHIYLMTLTLSVTWNQALPLLTSRHYYCARRGSAWFQVTISVCISPAGTNQLLIQPTTSFHLSYTLHSYSLYCTFLSALKARVTSVSAKNTTKYFEA